MNPTLTRKLIGGGAALFGLFWLSAWVYPFIENLFQADGPDGAMLFGLIFITPMMLIPGLLVTASGVRLFFTMSEAALKWLVGTLSVLGALFLSTWILALLPDFLPDGVDSFAITFGCSFPAIFAYLFVMRRLWLHLTGERRRHVSFVNRVMLFLMSIQLWLLSSNVIDAYAPVKDGYSRATEDLWILISVLIPIVVGIGAYHLCVGLFLSDKNADKPVSSSSS